MKCCTGWGTFVCGRRTILNIRVQEGPIVASLWGQWLSIGGYNLIREGKPTLWFSHLGLWLRGRVLRDCGGMVSQSSNGMRKSFIHWWGWCGMSEVEKGEEILPTKSTQCGYQGQSEVKRVTTWGRRWQWKWDICYMWGNWWHN